MVSTVSASPVGFLSHDGKTQIKGLVWSQGQTPGSAPRGIVQIVHGMAEHIGRYDSFARFLASRGFVVCASDHVGHGKSAPTPEALGCLPAEGGKDVLIEDVHNLRKMVAARYARQTPYVMFGHSMGSFVVRAYLARNAEDLAAAVICGTGQQSLALSKVGNILARRIASSKGECVKSALLHNMGAGSFSKQITDARTPFDWISTDPAVVDDYIADELCGVVFSAGGYATLTDLTGEVVTRTCAAGVPHDLPILFIAGAQDPVGGNGKGVRIAADLLRSAGVKQVDVTIYEGMRHEILNEPGHVQVYTDVAQWIEEHVCSRPIS